ncbi:DUF6317 family protein [Actinoallomurus rhizosphaericola]|uniref:DUF6317 family protein n=1 Tax=Actinoallomurus rhizosphaericola TaxID=2952536 RepID=UPI002090C6C8|nr:DUF6317 family protein [Actinoallomurus rhizosphaericola]MCO5992823.1 DUF6317 family protein [Actinoallomurus rhizosphaericola]
MSDGYKVVFDDLARASTEFSRQGEAYANLMTQLACPSGGDVTIDEILSVTLGALYEMHVVLSQAVSAHAYKLDFARRNYQQTEGDIFDFLTRKTPSPSY